MDPAIGAATPYSFFDATPDLVVGSVWNQDALAKAKQFYRRLFADLDDQQWPVAPEGQLGGAWGTRAPHTVSYVIHVADVIGSLLDGNATSGSISVIHDKVRTLLRPPPYPSERFRETLVELEVAATFGHLASPIMFEPCVPPDASPAAKPSSPDFGVRTSEYDLSIEVTVWHFGPLQSWDTIMGEVVQRIRRRVLKQGSKKVALSVPISSATSEDVEALAGSSVLAQIDASPSGELVVPTSGGNASIRWSPIPRVNSSGEIDPEMDRQVGGRIAQTTACPLIVDGWAETELKSLRNCLDRKRGQSVSGWPHLLVLGSDDTMPLEQFGPLVQSRILTNSTYAWINALAFFLPRTNFEPGSAPSQLQVLWNLQPRVPTPPSLIRAIDRLAARHAPHQFT
jgi:hypothetical protein